MGLKEIEAKIREDGQKQVDDINEKADRRIKLIDERIDDYAKKQAEKVRKDKMSEIELLARQIIADANIKAKQRADKERNLVIDRVFDAAKSKILNASDKEKKEMLESLAAEGTKEIKGGAEILVDKKYAKLLKDAVPSDIGDFGVIIKSNDGKLKIDNTLNNRLKQMEPNLRPKIASVLFS
ncbi:MAG: hypothetical protein A7316_00480 [Candidatus Altiarchaeales archaeon WOR_SM1_86-2]|nr:MAG: hypothetical protein A7315_13875 [Candidatus Altiarchaeales archaeon WOR_SM1_79]ODS39113.1 MAG: hypothetical protein A7316_00480 [Candidatus Altiarchaeales archaeon WOR_SM1_86-2]